MVLCRFIVKVEDQATSIVGTSQRADSLIMAVLGDRLVIWCQWVSNARNPGDFDYKEYLEGALMFWSSLRG
jgi:hypothetical protein